MGETRKHFPLKDSSLPLRWEPVTHPQVSEFTILTCVELVQDEPLSGGPTVWVAIVGSGGTKGPLPGGPFWGLRVAHSAWVPNSACAAVSGEGRESEQHRHNYT